jgi:pullulanase/glycogen debranching enzyme
MSSADWADGSLRSLAVQMSGTAYARAAPDGDLLAVFNADDSPLDMQLPAASRGDAWRVLIDTARADAAEAPVVIRCREILRVEARSTVLLEADARGSEAGA